jgi:hypothetical protein
MRSNNATRDGLRLCRAACEARTQWGLVMSANNYAATLGISWIDFTPQHARTREQAMSIARGEHSVPAGAIAGVYGCGKSTLLSAVIAAMIPEGVLPVWDEASPFLDRLVSRGVDIPEISEKITTLDQLDETIKSGASELKAINDLLNMGGRRLALIGGSFESDAYPTSRLDDARASLETLRAEIHRLKEVRLAGASEQAVKAYNALISQGYDDVYKPFRELRDLGLICTVEDDP